MTRRQGDTGDGLTQGWSFQNWNYDRPTQLPDPLLEMLAHLKMYLTHTSYMGRKKWNHLIGKLFWTRDTTLRTYSTESWWINDCSNKVKWIVDFRRFWIFNNNKKPPLGPDRLFLAPALCAPIQNLPYQQSPQFQISEEEQIIVLLNFQIFPTWLFCSLAISSRHIRFVLKRKNSAEIWKLRGRVSGICDTLVAPKEKHNAQGSIKC